MKRSESILEAIYSSALQFLVPSAPHETYEKIVREAIRLSDANYGSIAIRDKGKFVKVFSTNSLLFKEKNRRRANTYKAYKDKESIIVPFSTTPNAQHDVLSLGLQRS